MDTNEIAEKVIQAVRSNDGAYQKLSTAVLSQDSAQIKSVVQQEVGIELTDEQIETLTKDYGTPEQFAAGT